MTDALGFIAYEAVGILCSVGVIQKNNLGILKQLNDARVAQSDTDKKREDDGAADLAKRNSNEDVEMRNDDAASLQSRASKKRGDSSSRALPIPTSLFSAPEVPTRSGYATPVAPSAPPLSDNPAMGPVEVGLEDLHSAYVAMQNSHASFKSAGTRNWRSTRQRLRLPIL